MHGLPGTVSAPLGAAAFVLGAFLACPVAGAEGDAGFGTDAPASASEAGAANRGAVSGSAPAAGGTRVKEPAGRAAARSRSAVAVHPTSSTRHRKVTVDTGTRTQAARRGPISPGGPGIQGASAAPAAQTRTLGASIAAVAQTPVDSVAETVNGLFNAAFELLGASPPGPLNNLAQGALVLVRRSFFFIPTGVVASQTGTTVTVSVNTGSVAYLRQNGGTLQVSDVPLYCGATDFTASTVGDVVVNGNSGNRGSAGLYVTAGTLDANLLTTRIDAVTFGDEAAFTGTVNATAGANGLTLANAVRGESGVSLVGPVRLRTDVEVDAGAGDATFTGTVDATTSGEQALIVTALGTTTFTADVGAQAALAGLTTRGIAPLAIAQSADSRTIPLHYLPQYLDPLNPAPQLTVKYGIDVAIGDNPSRMYLFDTGAPGLFAGFDSAVWRNVALGTDPVYVSYGEGSSFDSVATDAVVTLGTGSDAVSSVRPIQVGAILAGYNSSGEPLNFTDPDAPPWNSHFFGDFGADLQVMTVNEQPTLASPLFQLPGNLSSGFLVQLGPIGNQPQLTVGVTDDLREQFPYAIPFTAAGAPYPVSGYPSAGQFAFTGQYSVSQPGGPTFALGTYDFPGCAQPCLPTLIDSGAPGSSVNLSGVTPPYPYAVDDADVSQPATGTTVTATFPTAAGRPPLTWSFVTGNNESVDLLLYYGNPAGSASSQTMGPGLTLYNAFDVMFDVRDQVIWLRPTGGQATVVLQSVTTIGAQHYAQNAELDGSYRTGGGDLTVGGVTTLIGETLIDVADGNVLFSGTVDGAVALTVNSGGTTTFTREVGSVDAPTALTTDQPGNSATNGVQTSGNQDYRDDVFLNGYYYAGGQASVGGSTVLRGPVDLTANGVTFGGPVDSLADKGFPLSLTASGSMVFGDAVGAANPLGGLSLANGLAGTQAVSAAAAAPINLNGALGYSTPLGVGLAITGVTVGFTGGGVIQQFPTAGIVIGESADSRIDGFAIFGNGNAAESCCGGIFAGGDSAVTDFRVSGGAITANYGSAVTVAGPGSFGNAVLSTSIYNNTGPGIVLSDGANGGQGAPLNLSARQLTAQTALLSGTVPAAVGYTGEFLVDVFGNVGINQPGQYFLGQTLTSAGTFSVPVPLSAGLPGFTFTSFAATATPATGAANTSQFSAPVPLT